MNINDKLFEALCSKLAEFGRDFKDTQKAHWDEETIYAVAELSYTSAMTSPRMLSTYLSEFGMKYQKIIEARVSYTSEKQAVINACRVKKAA